MTKVIKRKQKLEKVRGRQNFCCYIWKKTKYLAKVPPLEYTFAGFAVSCIHVTFNDWHCGGKAKE
jgi:hypothetical protein